MRIIPVMDLQRGKVVHAVGGQREDYKPLKTLLARSSDPLSIAIAFRRFGLKELYVADLDAICSTGHNLNPIGQISSQNMLGLIVDAGFRRADEVESYVKKGVKKIVLATETLGGFNEVSKVIAKYGVQVVASIDIKFGRVIAKSRSMQLPLAELIQKFEAEGASEVLLLSLDRVGTAQGPNHAILENTLSYATVPVLVGGGLRDITDVRRLQVQGASGVLVATALHNGTITKDDLYHL
ncbi:MAG: hypothetical protein AVW06_02135 [Hadesarchaea archaeon DG-33-1]|nr:MAG: hypothetical protein AVW06_02135 [Hadesarchaea archaeon DG-33-1]